MLHIPAPPAHEVSFSASLTSWFMGRLRSRLRFSKPACTLGVTSGGGGMRSSATTESEFLVYSKSGVVDASVRQPTDDAEIRHLLASRTSPLPNRKEVRTGALTSFTALSIALSIHARTAPLKM